MEKSAQKFWGLLERYCFTFSGYMYAFNGDIKISVVKNDQSSSSQRRHKDLCSFNFPHFHRCGRGSLSPSRLAFLSLPNQLSHPIFSHFTSFFPFYALLLISSIVSQIFFLKPISSISSTEPLE